VTSRPPELFDGVRETIERLAARYTLAVLTKGDPGEQNRKLKDSGIGRIFKKTFVVPEKNLDVYHQILQEQQWDPDHVCMIGNSPKSDINPALQAGLWAVYIPYPYTWKLDDEPVMHPHPRLKEIPSLTELSRYFNTSG
jgi:putative hydrolase of the HAD superfamily